MTLKAINEIVTEKKQRPVKVVQFGEGNFLRAFADYMIDILNEETDFNGNIVLLKSIRYGSISRFEEQNNLYKTIVFAEATPSLAQAIKMRSFSKEGKLSGEVIESIMCEEKPNQREKITFKAENIRRFVPSNYTAKQTEEYVLKALDFYKRHLDKQKDRGR